MDSCTVLTPIGIAEITGDYKGIRKVSIKRSEEKPSQNIPESLRNCAVQLHEYFYNTRKQFNLKLNLQGTHFQKKVWQQLQHISFGNACSYKELAKQLNMPKAIRAVANANAKNPLQIIVPCHRVIGANGSLVGYAGGLQQKKWLLNHEGFYKQQTLF